MNKIEKLDIVKCYLNQTQYLEGIVVEVCGNGNVWVEHRNGQQIKYREKDLVVENG